MKIMGGGVRWAFRFGNWKPNQEEWETGMRCIQPEEVDRIQKFVFQKDSKSSLVGRLMLRKAISEELSFPWKDTKLSRTDKGKPYICNSIPGAEKFNVNVSHHGDYTVLAAHKCCQVGVDVMKAEWPKSDESVGEFFRLMKRQFTAHEWQTIEGPEDEWDQLTTFHRHWCLKESYVKALGIGIGFNLQRIEFHIYSDLKCGHYTSDTRVHIDGTRQEQWRFEETMLDERHCVATAICIEDGTEFAAQATVFKELSFTELVTNSEHLGHSISPHSYSDFAARKDRPGQHKT